MDVETATMGRQGYEVATAGLMGLTQRDSAYWAAVEAELGRPGRCDCCSAPKSTFQVRTVAGRATVRRWCTHCAARRRATATTGRAAGTRAAGELRELVGYLVAWSDLAQLKDGVRERVLPGAFRHIGAGYPLLVNHRRRVSGAVTLSEDPHGVRVHIKLFEGEGQLLKAARAGRVRGFSFGFDDECSTVLWSKPPLRLRAVARVALTEVTLCVDRRPSYRSSWCRLATPANLARANHQQLAAAERALEEVAL